MKNKKYSIGLALLLTGSLALTFCTQDKTNVAPTADKDTSAATEVGMVELMVGDICEIGAQGCEGNSYITSYSYNVPKAIPNTTLNSTPANVNRDSTNKIFTITFNNTLGLDGKVRNGVLQFNYNTSTLNAKFNRQVGFRAVVTSTNYTCGDVDPAMMSVKAYSLTIGSMTIENKTPAGFNKAVTNLTWLQTSNMTIMNPAGGGTTTYNGSTTKTLLNTSATGTVNAPYQSSAIPMKWSFARTGWFGTGSGVLANGTAYTYKSEDVTQLTRDFTCSPEKLVYPEKHPFMSGLYVISMAGKGDRNLDFGQNSCDYNVTVTINGISYPLDIN